MVLSVIKKDYVTNLEGHPNFITGSRVMAILRNWLILPISGTSAVKGLRSTGLPRLVFKRLVTSVLPFVSKY